MRGNKSSGTKPELKLRKALWAAGMKGYRTNYRGLRGTPDIVYIGAQVAVFVDGCFWHACPEHYVEPKTRVAFWRAKAVRNRAYDEDITRHLVREGWKVVRIWEHEIRDDLPGCVQRVRGVLLR
jgi:DNA mismatch endonuclease (patch repair protein)